MLEYLHLVGRHNLQMPNKLLGTVDRFTSHFTKRLDEIESLKIPQPHQPEFFQCLLYASVLDTLAGSVLPKRRNNKDRFVYFIWRFCQWPDGERVSIMHLVQLLRKNPDPAFQKLREWALEQFKKLPVHGGQLMPITHDPSF